MITTLLVDDEPAILSALRTWLEFEPDLNIVGEARDGKAALALVESLHPHVVVLDVRLPDGDGLATAVALRQVSPQTQVVVLTLYDDKTTRAQADAAGVAAFVAKCEPAEALLSAIRRAANKA